jgi:hypothetical protein
MLFLTGLDFVVSKLLWNFTKMLTLSRGHLTLTSPLVMVKIMTLVMHLKLVYVLQHVDLINKQIRGSDNGVEHTSSSILRCADLHADTSILEGFASSIFGVVRYSWITLKMEAASYCEILLLYTNIFDVISQETGICIYWLDSGPLPWEKFTSFSRSPIYF